MDGTYDFENTIDDGSTELFGSVLQLVVIFIEARNLEPCFRLVEAISLKNQWMSFIINVMMRVIDPGHSSPILPIQ